MRSNSTTLLGAGLVALSLGGAVASGCRLANPITPAPDVEVAALRGRSDDPGRTRTFNGPAIPLGRGVAQAWVVLDRDGTPRSIGVDLTAKALEGLGSEPIQRVLTFHPRAAATPFTHVLLDFNPEGHEPPGVYDLEHFDVHFYLTSIADRLAIGPDDAEQFGNAPDARYLPSDYLQVPGGVPQMGAHWVDLLAPEFNGGTFSRTFIWGSYDGEVTFIEPMITTAYLRSMPDESIRLRQPRAFQKDGYYPTSYRISHAGAPDRYRIALEGLTFRRGD